jgi:hypothetical protein
MAELSDGGTGLNQQVMAPSRLYGVRDWVIVFYRKLPHVMNVRVLNRAMRDRQIAGDFDSVHGLADRIKCSRSTVSRFFSGRNTSLTVTLQILGALRLTFDQVFVEISAALVARLQAEGVVQYQNGVVVVTTEILAWPEAVGIREHFGLPVLAPGSGQQALPPAGQSYHDGVGGQLAAGTAG